MKQSGKGICNGGHPSSDKVLKTATMTHVLYANIDGEDIEVGYKFLSNLNTIHTVVFDIAKKRKVDIWPVPYSQQPKSGTNHS